MNKITARLHLLTGNRYYMLQTTTNVLDTPDPKLGVLAATRSPSRQELEDDPLPDNVDELRTHSPIVAYNEVLSNCEPVITAVNPDAPLGIVVRCLLHKIPSRRFDRTATIANIICQYLFQQDIDTKKEYITSLGLKDINRKKVRFLFECSISTPDTIVEDGPIIAFKWTGHKL